MTKSLKRRMELEFNLAQVEANIKELNYKKLLKEEDIQRIEDHRKLQENRKKEIESELDKL